MSDALDDALDDIFLQSIVNVKRKRLIKRTNTLFKFQ